MQIRNITIVGAGRMGAGIATVASQAGLTVSLVDLNSELLRNSEAIVAKSLARGVEKQAITEEEKASALSRIGYSTDLGVAASSQLVIEAIIESAGAKRDLLATLSTIVSSEAIIATNTSALSVTELATSVESPSRFLGIHFFNPVPVMKLVELVQAEETSQETMDIAQGFVESIGKEAVRLKDSSGFIVNRILVPMINDAAVLLGEGVATAEHIDTAMTLGANLPIGPLALADMIGLDVVLSIMETLKTRLKSDRYTPAPELQRLVAEGKLGRKSGEGFYDYG
jgi:3-hydroxybutyryl-CoA dehydrogenase